MAKSGKYWFNDKWQQGIYGILRLRLRQTDATLMVNNSQHCWMLHVASVFTPCCMLLRVVGSCCAKFEAGQTFEPTTPNICFVLWSPKRTALPTLLGQRTRISHGLQWLMGCNLPMMHCSSKHCWELLHPFAQHCRHGRNNSHHCWPNNVGSFCVRLHVSLLWLKREIGRVVTYKSA